MTAARHVEGDMQAQAAAAALDPDPIVDLIRAGQHREALTTCARTHHVVLGRLCIALLGSQADADEAVQETLLRAHRGMATFRGEGTIKAWLCGIARHVCAHVLETRRRGRELLELVPSAGEARDGFEVRRRARVIRDALERLKPSEREALVMRYVADLSHREIAIACGLDEPAARKRISRALARLRQVLPTEEIDS
jgi:RNA polymerase sigma-70 factor, ECF subfamily